MKLLKTQKLGGLDTFVKSIAGVAIVLGVSLVVLQSFGDTLDAGTEAANATAELTAALGDVPTWIGIIIVVAMAALVMGYFYTKNN